MQNGYPGAGYPPRPGMLRPPYGVQPPGFMQGRPPMYQPRPGMPYPAPPRPGMIMPQHPHAVQQYPMNPHMGHPGMQPSAPTLVRHQGPLPHMQPPNLAGPVIGRPNMMASQQPRAYGSPQGGQGLGVAGPKPALSRQQSPQPPSAGLAGMGLSMGGTGQGAGPINVFVGKLAVTVDNDLIQDIMAACGRVTKWNRAEDPSTNLPKSFGFCTYHNADAAAMAVKLLNGLTLERQEIQVKVGKKEQEIIEPFLAPRAGVDADRQATREKSVMDRVKAIVQQFQERQLALLEKEANGAGGVEAMEEETPEPPRGTSAAQASKDSTAVHISKRRRMQEAEDYSVYGGINDYYGNENMVQSEIEKFRQRQAERDRKMEDERRQELQRKLKEAQRQEKEKQEAAIKAELDKKMREAAEIAAAADAAKREEEAEQREAAAAAAAEAGVGRDKDREGRRHRSSRSRSKDRSHRKESKRSKRSRSRDKEHKDRRRDRDGSHRDRERDHRSGRGRDSEEERAKREADRKARRRMEVLAALGASDDANAQMIQEADEAAQTDSRALEPSHEVQEMSAAAKEEAQRKHRRKLEVLQMLSVRDEHDERSDEDSAPPRAAPTYRYGESPAPPPHVAAPAPARAPSPVPERPPAPPPAAPEPAPLVPQPVRADPELVPAAVAVKSEAGEESARKGAGFAFGRAPPKKMGLAQVFGGDDDDKKLRPFLPVLYTEDEKQAGAQAFENQRMAEAARGAPPSARASPALAQSPPPPMSGGVAPVAAPVEKKDKDKAIVELIPRERPDLFGYPVDWVAVEAHDIVQTKMKPWIVKKVVEYLGEPDQTLIDFIITKLQQRSGPQPILNELALILEEDAEILMMKMWRMLIFCVLRLRAG